MIQIGAEEKLFKQESSFKAEHILICPSKVQ